MGLIAIVIFVALLAFILTDFFSGISRIVAGPPDAGEVAGEPISDQVYRTRVNEVLSQVPGGDELQTGRVRDDVWNRMVSEMVFDKEFESVGLEVTGAEIYDMFAGRNISPYVRQYFQQFFDMQGKEFNIEDVKRYLDIAAQNPDERVRLARFEADLARARAVERYFNMISAAYTGSQAMARQRYQDQNHKVNLSFLAVNYSSIPDSTVSVSDSELRRYMQDHKEQYKQGAETYIRYVRFALQPSPKDSVTAFKSIQRLRASFAETENDSVYTSNKSRVPYGQSYEAIYDLPEQIRDSVATGSAGDIYGPLMDQGYYKLFKLVGTEAAEAPAAKINHILITYKGDTAAAETKARDLLRQARSGDFAEVASANSDDFNSRTRGGALGWYRRGQFGEDFDEAVDRASVGSIIGPIKGRGGFHIVQVVAKTNRTYDIAEIEEEIIYSTSTRDSVYGEANLFASQLISTQDINESAAAANVVAFESNALTDQSRDVLGLNGGRELIVWAIFSDVGEISKVLRINDNYVIAQVTEKKEEGLRDLEDVRDEVTLKVRNEKKGEQIARQLREMSGQDLNAMKDAYGVGATVASADNVTFESNTIPGIGNDRVVIGRAMSLEQGVISEPIQGDKAVYVLQVTGITEAGEAPESTLTSLRESIVSQGQVSLQNKIEAGLTELAEVVDKRAQAEARGYGY